MSHGFHLRPILNFAVILLGLWLPAMAQEPDAAPKEREEKILLRFVCVSSLAKEQEVVLASRNEKGDWLELSPVGLRPSFITEWLPAATGELHLALREAGGLKSICKFTYPASARRALVVLVADRKKKVYRPVVIDPQKMEFSKGSVLVVNFSTRPGMVLLGSKKILVKSGQRVVAKPSLDSNGMYRMMVAYAGDNKEAVPCYDRFIPGNPDSRDMMFLFPDPTLGFRVFSLPMFGDLD